MLKLPLVGEALTIAGRAWRELAAGRPLEAVDLARRQARLYEGFLRGRPIHCVVQVTNRCNLACGFCSFWERPAPLGDELTVGELERISDELGRSGAMVVSIEGGEPLLRPDIAAIVRAFARHHHPILFTNGWRMSEPLARDLWHAGLTAIGVSIDYPDARRHDAHRGQAGTFDAALAAVDLLRATAPGGARQVMLMTVLMHDNVDDLEALLELSAARGVAHQVTLISTTGDGRHHRAQKLPPAGVGARLAALKRRHPHLITFSNYLDGIDRFLAGEVRTPCWAGRRFLNIDHLGGVSPCIEKLRLGAGNLRTDSWETVYANLNRLEEPRRCTDCYTACRGFVEEMSGWPRRRSYEEFWAFGQVTSPRNS